MTEVSGASVIVPAGALTTATTIRVAMDSTGAPAVPQGLAAVGNTYAITPHGGSFDKPVEVRLPAPAVTLQPNQQLKIAKAQPDGAWVILDATTADNGFLAAKVDSFSFFTVVTITYPLPIAQFLPFSATGTLDCGEQTCDGRFLTVAATYVVTTNYGQLPANCDESSLVMRNSVADYSDLAPLHPITKAGGTLTETVNQEAWSPRHSFYTTVRCSGGVFGPTGYYLDMFARKTITWKTPPQDTTLAVMSSPQQLDVVDGRIANLDLILGGGALSAATNDRAVIEWERSNDGGASWRPVARSYQGEGNPVPLPDWRGRVWSVRYGFIATTTDQGALIRAHACYAPPSGTAPPCIFSPGTRINVLQQSALPAIETAPRSLLVRTGQTASLSASATGLPAPTLQWQTRPANSEGAWSNVAAGTGATGANYTTLPLTLSDNGVQFRIVATNPVGSTASAPVSVSVSDVDVAPTITTQPANLSVTAGSDAVFAIEARGTEALSFQWRFKGADIPGANSAVLRLTGVTNAQAGSYSVTVGNAAGDEDSISATLTVTPGGTPAVAPSIVTQPSAVTVNTGNTATFAVGVGGSGPFSYQWRRDGVNISGATSAAYTINSVALPHAGAYSVVVSNSAGTVTSSAVALDVVTSGADLPPTIVTQPATVVVPRGSSTILAVAAAGSGPLSYQWLNDGVEMGGETQAVLFLDSVGESNEERYSVRVSNSYGSVTSIEVKVIVLGAPTITTSPSDITVGENASATFNVEAGGTGIRYQWLRNGLEIPGATEHEHTTSPLTLADSGAVYSVVVYNSAGITLSQPAVLTVVAVVPPTVLQQPADVTIDSETSAQLCVAFGGTPSFSVKMDRMLHGWTNVGSAVTVNDNGVHCFSTPALSVADDGAQFRVYAINAAGTGHEAISRTVTVTVLPAGRAVVTQQPADVTVEAGSPASLCFALGGTAPFRVRLERMLHGWSPVGSSVTINDNGVNCINTPALSAADDGAQFRITAGATAIVGYETASRAATITVHTTPPPPVVTGLTLVSVNTSGAGSYGAGFNPSLSGDGHLVAFTSGGGDLVTGFDNTVDHAYVRNLTTGVTVPLDAKPDGTQPTQPAYEVKMAAGGRYALFTSFADGVVADDTNFALDLFLRDLQNGTTKRLSLLPNGQQLEGIGNGRYSMRLDISADGRWVTFASPYQLAAGALPDVMSLYVRDTVNDVTTLVATNVNYIPQWASISDDGRQIVYAIGTGSPASMTQLVNSYDIESGHTDTVFSFVQTNDDYLGPSGDVSADGRFVTFTLRSPTMLGGSTKYQVVVVDRTAPAGTFTVASANSTGIGVGDSHYPQISGDGRYVQFESVATNLTGSVSPISRFLVVRDMAGLATAVSSRRADGSIVPLGSWYGHHSISADGKVTAMVGPLAAAGDQVYAQPRP